MGDGGGWPGTAAIPFFGSFFERHGRPGLFFGCYVDGFGQWFHAEDAFAVLQIIPRAGERGQVFGRQLRRLHLSQNPLLNLTGGMILRCPAHR